MTERRQAFRKEPIEIDFGDNRTVSVGPLPWQERNDFGDEVIRQYLQILNEAVLLYVDPDTGAPQLEAKLGEKFSDPQALMKLGLSEDDFKTVQDPPLGQNQIVIVLLAIAEVNDLQQLYPMLDPNLETPTSLSGILWELVQEGLTPKTESGPDSSSPGSEETPSEPSLTQS